MTVNEYNVIGEFVGLTVALITLFIMNFSKPKKTTTYIIVLMGLICSVIDIVLIIILHLWANRPQFYHRNGFASLAMVFLLVYFVILLLIYNFMYSLSVKKPGTKRISNVKVGFILVPCMIIANILLSTGQLFVFHDNRVEFKYFSVFYLTCGTMAAIASVITVISMKRYIAKAIYRYAVIFCFADIFLLVFQILTPNIGFSSLTYVFPFMIFYILFHSVPYDEYTGCQNRFSYEARFQDNMIFKKKFVIAYIRIPELEHMDFSRRNKTIDIVLALACRELERLGRKIFIYRLESSRFAIFINQKNYEKGFRIVDRIVEIVKATENGIQYITNVKVIAFHDHKLIDHQEMLDSMADYLFEQLDKQEGEKKYYAAEEDYGKVQKRHMIEQALLDIRTKHNLDDERVICFAQPIYSVERKSFRTAESLMRLKLNGEMIFPDQFIEVAENINCIHVLTCIMLNKICKQIKVLQEEYEFDGITLNCSSKEFSESGLDQELLQIIRENDVNPKLIRIELTESAMLSNLKTVMHNMTSLKKEGICFYLDDFGTGYSNMERIISYPFHTIKFDKSLLYKALEDPKLEELLTHMVMVFKNIGLHILVEGVEDENQTNYSIEHGFEYLQGYHYSKPRPIEELTVFFTKTSRSA